RPRTAPSAFHAPTAPRLAGSSSRLVRRLPSIMGGGGRSPSHRAGARAAPAPRPSSGGRAERHGPRAGRDEASRPVTFPPSLRALNHRDFRQFLGAQIISQFGSWMQSVAQAWLVLELTNSPFRLGLLGTLQFGPFLLLSLVSGTLVDRFPRRRVLVATQLVFA